MQWGVWKQFLTYIHTLYGKGLLHFEYRQLLPTVKKAKVKFAAYNQLLLIAKSNCVAHTHTHTHARTHTYTLKNTLKLAENRFGGLLFARGKVRLAFNQDITHLSRKLNGFGFGFSQLPLQKRKRDTYIEGEREHIKHFGKPFFRAVFVFDSKVKH